MRLASTLTLLLASQFAAPPTIAYSLDTTFNAGGFTQDYLDLGSSKADFFADLALAPGSGSFYSVGRSESGSSGGATIGVLFKRLANGTKDPAFVNGSSVSRVLFGAERSGGSSALAAVDFDSSGGGAVLAAGFNDLANGKRCGVVYKVLDNAAVKGALDGGYGSSGRFTHCASDSSAIEFTDIRLLPDGRALVVGNGALASGEAYGFLVRLTAAGQIDASFNAGAPRRFDLRPGKDDVALRVAVSAHGYYVAGNSVYARNPETILDDDIDLWVARVTTAGALDTGFNGSGKRIEPIDLPDSDMTDLLADLAIDASGRVLLLGNINPAHFIYTAQGDPASWREDRSQSLVIRLTPAGSRDTSFGSGTGQRVLGASLGGCSGNHFCDYDEPASLIVQPDGSIVVAGRHVRGGFIGAVPSSQLTLNWTNATGYTGGGQEFHHWPRSEGAVLIRQYDGKLAIGGLVRTVSTVSDVDFAITRFQVQ